MRLPRRLASDGGVALALAGLALVEIWLPGAPWVGEVTGARGWLTVTALGATLPLAWRRRRPLAVVAAVFAALAAQSLLTDPVEGLSAIVAAALAVYSAAAWLPRRPALTGLGLAVAAIAPFAGDATDAAFAAILAGFAWLTGRTVRRSRARAAELEEALGLLERERAANAALALAAERARIARELHDVVGHSMSVMVLQAGAVRRLLAPAQADERAALAAVEATGREALGDVRRVLGMLRRDEPGDSPAVPERLAHLEALVEQVRQAGLPVTLTVEGTPTRLPPGLDLSAYRIVQEALTNALRHAGPASATVMVRYRPGAVELEVADDGRGVNGRDPAGGNGLVGMRERALLFGGELSAGPAAAGGFVVRARLRVGGHGVTGSA